MTARWRMPDGTMALHERTRFAFGADALTRSIERVTELTAGDREVRFADNKEGLLGLRVARALEEPADEPEHPQNPGHPTHWHARGYGLFAANPLGPSVFTKGARPLDFTLPPRTMATFRHLLVVLPGPFSRESAERAAAQFAR